MKDVFQREPGLSLVVDGRECAATGGRFQSPDFVVLQPRPLAGRKQVRVYRNVFKRVLDVSLVLLSLPVTLPLVLICAALLWMESGLPFYQQSRLGKDGRTFRMLKLRTMVRDAEHRLTQILEQDPALRAEWDATQKLKKDPRITPVGAFLRATSLDELPQLWNVLIGDMSLVGPRPMMPAQLSIYGCPDAYFAVRPGITGLWQVSARNETRFDYRSEVDTAYFRSMSFPGDLVLIFKTFGVVLQRTGY
jgi:lipopolysaccharide/colanic/teichoic acid biosynthesis glycosyltransferase